MKEGLKAQANVDATVACEGRWKAAKVGEVFQCLATSGDHKATVEVTTKDLEGNISWKVQSPYAGETAFGCWTLADASHLWELTLTEPA